MKYNASLAWAMPVDPVVLGPQIEAYVETKGKMPAFQRCVEHAPFGTSLGQVPAEVIEIIGGHVRHLTFLVHQERWKSEIECWHGTCCPSKHIDHNEYLRLKHDYMKGFETFGPRLIGGVEEYGHYRSQEFDATQFEKHLKRRGVGDYGHRMQTERFEAKIDHRNNQFNSARKVVSFIVRSQIHILIYHSSDILRGLWLGYLLRALQRPSILGNRYIPKP